MEVLLYNCKYLSRKYNKKLSSVYVIINIFLQFNSTIRLNVLKCQRNNIIGVFIDIFLTLELYVVILILVYLSIRNLRITDPRFREEGQSIARFGVAVLITSIPAITVYTLIDNQHGLPNIMLLFWIQTAISIFSSVLLFSAVFVPKVS